jgi:hypothetical protein
MESMRQISFLLLRFCRCDASLQLSRFALSTVGQDCAQVQENRALTRKAPLPCCGYRRLELIPGFRLPLPEIKKLLIQ